MKIFLLTKLTVNYIYSFNWKQMVDADYSNFDNFYWLLYVNYSASVTLFLPSYHLYLIQTTFAVVRAYALHIIITAPLMQPVPCDYARLIRHTTSEICSLVSKGNIRWIDSRNLHTGSRYLQSRGSFDRALPASFSHSRKCSMSRDQSNIDI